MSNGTVSPPRSGVTGVSATPVSEPAAPITKPGGLTVINYAIKVLDWFQDYATQANETVSFWRGLFQWACLITVFLVHAAIVVVCIAATVPLLLMAEWYVGWPLLILLGALLFGMMNRCPLTRVENYVRAHFQPHPLPQINSFIGHYFVGTITRLLNPK